MKQLIKLPSIIAKLVVILLCLSFLNCENETISPTLEKENGHNTFFKTGQLKDFSKLDLYVKTSKANPKHRQVA